ncbi:succinyl-diaminopimelate desuccinylase [Salinisphaera orenii MK-B5]|uniref:Succinyl-diaminopimelate desuccinylase n=1 Tax=Salinisphaera orenii MK-B5 TaxID=856730 RepID=A0A423PXL1_9GAMM|nr:succinyl-diaminopimelate desuccinylase [Salinisphaera orenii]ROO30346.1 succinyl-diaminopimelate desuccinylase [Salinisphaera orenii MK-B5]
MAEAALELARALIARASVTPDDAGCQALIAERLAAAGFEIHHLRFGEVDNLWAVAGDSGPLLCFAGHTDVVPPGPVEDWHHEPFSAELADGWLYGRGAADMKSSVAAMVCASERFRAAHPDHAGRLGFLITSDEEGPAVDGTRAVVDWLAERDIAIDYCVVGEPSSTAALGDTLRNGRRGSLNGHVRVRGRQGHVAYPDSADNALHRLVGLLADLGAQHWDDGDDFFPPTSFQVSNIRAGTGAENVIPGTAEARFNWRFNPCQDEAGLRARVERLAEAHGIDTDAFEWRLSGHPFVTRPGALIDATRAAVAEVCGTAPALSTGGGTSDGRFIAPTGAEVIELGPLNATIHQVNEHIAAADVARLSDIYERIAARLLGG